MIENYVHAHFDEHLLAMLSLLHVITLSIMDEKRLT